ncbi:hypothetical protein GCM10022237_41460 [Nocardioides ginsengisoli]|uniref:DUF4064 domain-containing protein n=1 Tax=Nocardioides ginsengisoli TaxID=363868 RepID=A0ABW3W5Y9_9ACTN
MSEEQPRPGQATLAGALIIAGAVVVVLGAWDRIAGLHSLEGQRHLASDPLVTELGMSLDGVETMIRVLCLIGAGAATAAVILGTQVYRRSLSARVALTALTPLFLVGGIAIDVFPAFLLIAGVALLWASPTRDWYAGRPWVQAYEERRAARAAMLRPPAPPAPSSLQGPSAGPGAPGASQQLQRPVPPPYPAPVPRPVAGPRGRIERGPRPPALIAACVLTWLTALVVVVGLSLGMTRVASESGQVFAEMKRTQPQLVDAAQVTEQQVVTYLYLILAGMIAWALVAVLLAGLAYAGQNWARITLAVSGIGAAGLTLLGSGSAWPLIIVVALIAGATALLMRGEIGRWYAGGR